MKISSKRMFYRLTKGNKNAEYTTFTTFMDKKRGQSEIVKQVIHINSKDNYKCSS